MAVITPPAGVLRPRDATFFPRWTTRTAGRRLSDGQEQIVSPGYCIWQIDYAIPATFDGEMVRKFEVFIRELRGRANIAALTVCDPYRYGAKVSPMQEPWSDGTWFTDGTGFVSAAGGVHPLAVTIPVAAGATTLRTDFANPTRPRLRPGDYFSAEGRLYAVQNSSQDGWVRFEPPARQAIPAGAVLQTDAPVIHARLADDDQGRRARELLRWGAPVTLSFVEAD